jgi:hypothetical protein
MQIRIGRVEMATELDSEYWLAVIGRSLAYISMKASGENQSLQKNAFFLEALGLNRSDVAAMLGTSAASIGTLHHQARKRKGASRGTKKANTRKTR